MHDYPPTTPGPVGTHQPHRGVLILVLGILGLIVCAPLGIASWVMGAGDLKKIKAGVMDPDGRGLTLAGMICGIVASVLLVLGLAYVLLVVVVMGGLAAAGAAGGGGP